MTEEKGQEAGQPQGAGRVVCEDCALAGRGGQDVLAVNFMLHGGAVLPVCLCVPCGRMWIVPAVRQQLKEFKEMAAGGRIIRPNMVGIRGGPIKN